MDMLDTDSAQGAALQAARLADESSGPSSTANLALATLLEAMRAYQDAATKRRVLRLEISWNGVVDPNAPAALAAQADEVEVTTSVGNGLGNGAQWTYNLRFLEPAMDASAHVRIGYTAAHAGMLAAAQRLAKAWQAHPVLRPMACMNAGLFPGETGMGRGAFYLQFVAHPQGQSVVCKIGPLTLQGRKGSIDDGLLCEAVAKAAACPPGTPRSLLLESTGQNGIHLSMIGTCYGQADAWKRLWATLHHPISGVAAWADVGSADSTPSPDPLDRLPRSDLPTAGPQGQALEEAWETAWDTAMALPDPAPGASVAVIWNGATARWADSPNLAQAGAHPAGPAGRAHLRAVAALGAALAARYPLIAEMARKRQVVFHVGDGALHKMRGRDDLEKMLWLVVCGLPLTMWELGKTLAGEGLDPPHPHPDLRALQSLWIDVLSAARTAPPSRQVVAMEHQVEAAHREGRAPRFQWSKLGTNLRPDGTAWAPSPKLRRALQAFSEALHAGWPVLRTLPGSAPSALRVHPRGLRDSIAVQWETQGVWWPGMLAQIAPCHGIPSTGPRWMVTYQRHWKRLMTFQAGGAEDARRVAESLGMADGKRLWKEAF